MANYVYIDSTINRGKMAISANVFDQLVSNALSRVNNISMSQKQMKKNQSIRLNRPIQTKISREIVHVWVSIDIKKGTDIHEAQKAVQDEVMRTLMASAETIPFDVQVKVESII